VVPLVAPSASNTEPAPATPTVVTTQTPATQEVRPTVLRTSLRGDVVGYVWASLWEEEMAKLAPSLEVAPPPRVQTPAEVAPAEVAPPPQPEDETSIRVELTPAAEQSPADAIIITTVETPATAPPVQGATAELFAVAPLPDNGSQWTWLATAVGAFAVGYWVVRRGWLTPAWESLTRRWAAFKVRFASKPA